MSVVTCPRPESRTQRTVAFKDGRARSGICGGYQTPARMPSCVSTRDQVVLKDALFATIMRVLISGIDAKKRSVRILEPGMGQFAFAQVVAHRPFTDRFDEIVVEGGDTSQGPPTCVTEVIAAHYQSKVNGSRVTVVLNSGVNCIDATASFYRALKSRDKRFDAVVASQFEHYCPNGAMSPLAERYRELGVPFSTKTEFRYLCYDLLDQGGFYFTIDDRWGEPPEEYKTTSGAPDSHVGCRFMNDNVVESLASEDPALAKNLRLSHDLYRSSEALLSVTARVRAYRRTVCCEETEPLSATRRDFAGLFGERNVYCTMHPSIETHPGFYLMWAVKRR